MREGGGAQCDDTQHDDFVAVRAGSNTLNSFCLCLGKKQYLVILDIYK